MSIGKRIKEARNSAGYTQQKLADLVGLKRNSIGVYEIDGRVPGDRSIRDIARACHVSESWLLTGKGPRSETVTEYDEIKQFVNSVLSGHSDDTRRRFLLALSRLDDDGWKSIASLAEILAKEK